jgi:hypothetical protein
MTLLLTLLVPHFQGWHSDPKLPISWSKKSSSEDSWAQPSETDHNGWDQDSRMVPEGLCVGVLDRQTYQGGTWGSRLCGGGSWSGDRELEGVREDTGHKTYTGSGHQGGEPYILFGVSSMAPCAWCWVEIRCPARYPALLYIVQGAGS